MGKRRRGRGVPIRGMYGGKIIPVRKRKFPPTTTSLCGPDKMRLCEGNRQLRIFENRCDSDKFENQEKLLSSDIVTTAKPQSPSRLSIAKKKKKKLAMKNKKKKLATM